MEVNMSTLHVDMLKLQKEIEFIKNVLLSEGELSDWAREELKGAREEDKERHTSLGDLREEIENDL